MELPCCLRWPWPGIWSWNYKWNFLISLATIYAFHSLNCIIVCRLACSFRGRNQGIGMCHILNLFKSIFISCFSFLFSSPKYGMNSLTCVITGHCTNVPRNINLEKLQNNYLFPEVIFIISCSWHPFLLGFRLSLTNLTF